MLPLPNLNLDLKNTDISSPRLAAGKYDLEISSVDCQPSKRDESNYNLLVEFKTTDEAPDNKGGTLQPGYTLRRYFPLQQSPNPKAPDFKVDITKLLMAAYNVEQSECPDFNDETVSGLVGRRLTASVKLKDDEQYGPSNEVGGFKAIAA